MEMSTSVVNLSKALFAAQSTIENPTRDKNGYNYKYADLPQVLEKIRNALTPNNLSFLQMVGEISDNKIAVKSMLLHTSGEYISSTSEIYIDDKMKSKTQGVGSAITYLRRKSALSFFSLGEEDEIDCRIEEEPKNNKNQKAQQVATQNASNQINYGQLLNMLSDAVSKSSSPSETKKHIFEKYNVQCFSELSVEEVQYLIARLQKAGEKKSA